MMGRSHVTRLARLCAVLATPFLALAAVPAAAQAVSLIGTDATVQPGSSSPVRINQPFGSSNWSASANGAGTIWAGNGIQIPGVSPNRWFCYVDLNGNRSWGLRTRTVGWNGAGNCPTNGLGSVSTSGLVAVIVEDGPPPSVVVQFPLNSSYWTSNYGYARSGAQTAVTTSQLTAANARTAERVLLVHTGASGGTLCITGSETGCATALTWIPNAAASTAVSAAEVTSTGFNVGWSGGWTGTSAGSFYLFVSQVASGLTVDVSSGSDGVTGPAHAVTGLTANTRYVATVCSRLATGGAGELCYDSSADTGIQGVEVTTLAAPPEEPQEPEEPPEEPPPNRAPLVADAPGAIALEAGGTAAIALSGAFLDPDGDPLTLSAASSRPAVATARLDGTTLAVAAVAEGQSQIAVYAADPDGATARFSFLVTVGNPVSIGGDAAGMEAVAASAPEGGAAEVPIAMAEPREEDVSFAYSFGPDGDAATADADAADHGGEGGTVTIVAGETEAIIRIPILDDDDIEPAREAFTVTLTPMDGAGVAVSTATVHIAEGVCDRSWQVADALRGASACEAVTPAELMRRRTVRLPDAGLDELHPLDFLDLGSLTTLILDGNGLSALPEGLLAGSPKLRVLRLRGNRFETLPALGSAPELIELDLAGNLLAELPADAFADLPALGYLYLGGNGLEALPADLLAEAEAMRILHLEDNALETLPEGLFAGVPKLFSLQLQGNPGTPFTLPVELARVEAEDEDEAGEGEAGTGETGAGEESEEEPGRADIQLRVPHGAPFAIEAAISAPGATLSAQIAAVAAGDTLGDPVSVIRDVAGNEANTAVTVEIDSMTSLPTTACGDEYDEYRCFRGFELAPGSPLTLFEPPAAADVPTMR